MPAKLSPMWKVWNIDVGFIYSVHDNYILTVNEKNTTFNIVTRRSVAKQRLGKHSLLGQQSDNFRSYATTM
jgi:hypothetical protein